MCIGRVSYIPPSQNFTLSILTPLLLENINLTLSVFKNSYIHLTLNLAMKSDVMDEVTQDIIEEHTYHRTVFLGTAYIQAKVTNAMDEDNA